ncbi:visual pigment-like receptor peropsin isoform X2 [Nilaparvata lugens]|uniref:visual pigment-like receptor peropsin isoform X2 n=1 Tax=Nilaparvata lugens TaxID=108931 RepID=UPI00193DDA81|nr:visual pigment-like receptor peropsin isoform X2 [Nilaparvata lugens]
MFCVSGFLSSLFNGWLIGCLFLRSEFLSQFHLLFMNLSIACLGHNLLAGFPFQGTSAISRRWLFGKHCCQLFASLDKFFNNVEVLASILIILERYSSNHLDKLGNKFYFYAVLSSWIASMVYASLPFFDISKFVCDAAGISCSLDWHPQKQVDQLYIAVYIIISVLPTLVICGLKIQEKCQKRKYNLRTDDDQITEAVTMMIILMQISWIPSGLVSLFSLINIRLPKALVFMAPIANTISTAIPFITIFCYDQEVRRKLLGTLQRRQGWKMRRLAIKKYRRNPSPCSIDDRSNSHC